MTSAIRQLEVMPKTICIVHIKTIGEGKHHLNLMPIVINDFYQHSTLTPIYGNGQGSTNPPVAWLFILNITFKCHHKHAHGTFHQDLKKNNKVHLYLLGSVDDINLYSNLFYINHNDIPQLLLQLHEDKKLFSNLLWTTSGQFEPKKCTYYMMVWEFDEDGKQYIYNTIQQLMVIKAFHRKRILTVQYILLNQSSKYLGHYKELNSSQIKYTSNFQTWYMKKMYI